MKFDKNSLKGMLLKTGDDTYQVPRLDSSSHSIQMIGYEHHEVHAGRFFRSGMNFTLANGNVATFGLITPPTSRQVHTNGTSANVIRLVLEWYEHEPRSA